MRGLIGHPGVGILALVCAAALCSIGHPEAEAARVGTSVRVLMCVGSPDEEGNCGPKPKVRGGSLRYSWGSAGARHAGIVRAPRSNIKCPPARSCAAPVPRGERVTLTVRKNASYGRHEFDHWEGDCESFGDDQACTIPASGIMRAVAVFRLIY